MIAIIVKQWSFSRFITQNGGCKHEKAGIYNVGEKLWIKQRQTVGS
jgi:hypothetical protein